MDNTNYLIIIITSRPKINRLMKAICGFCSLAITTQNNNNINNNNNSNNKNSNDNNKI